VQEEQERYGMLHSRVLGTRGGGERKYLVWRRKPTTPRWGVIAWKKGKKAKARRKDRSFRRRLRRRGKKEPEKHL